MALIWATGFELQSVTAGVEWRTSTSGSPSIETGTFRSGFAALRINNAAAAENIQHIVASAQGARFYRVYFYLVVPATTGGVSIVNVANSVNRKVEFRIDTAAGGNQLTFFNVEDNAAIGTDSPNLITGTWYHLDWKIDSTTLSATVCEARLYAASDESTLLWNPSGTIDITADPNRFVIGTVGSNATLDIIFDDVRINDDSGSYCNTWPGEGEIIILRPNGAGSSSDWARGGTSDLGANYLQVSETVPDDAGTYVEDNTAGQIDRYTLQDTPASMANDDVINWVAPGARFALSSTTGGDPDFAVGIEVGANSDITSNLSGAGATSYTSWQTTLGNIPALNNNSNYEVPGGSSAYTKADLDSAIFHLEETVSDTHLQRVTAAWVYVEHKPAPATPSFTAKFRKTLSHLGTRVGVRQAHK